MTEPGLMRCRLGFASVLFFLYSFYGLLQIAGFVSLGLFGSEGDRFVDD